MPTETHDEMIEDAIFWAKSLGYKVTEIHKGNITGADAIFENRFGERVILEVETGADFRKLLSKERIQKELKSNDNLFLGLIIVGDRIENLTQHGIDVGLSNELFESGSLRQKVFSVGTKHYERVIPALLVSLLGTRATTYGRIS
jgi:hypothetical protein